MGNSGVKALHIGAGANRLNGWLESDIEPSDRSVIHLDATKRFPLSDNCMDYIYSEHVIENLPHFGGQTMLRECRRVLKPRGVVRIATPDLMTILSLIDRDDEESSHYRKYISNLIYFDENPQDPVTVINNAFRAWGHQYLYNERVLASDIRRAGFDHVHRVDYGNSDYAMLQGVEQHGANMDNERAARFETMIIEAS